MATFNYRLGMARFGHKEINCGATAGAGDAFNLTFVTSAYTPDQNADDVIADIPGGAVVLTETLPNCFMDSGGIFRADDFISSAGVPSGSTIAALVISHNSTGALLRYIDAADGLVYATDDEVIVVTWPGVGIFRLGAAQI